MNIPDWPDDIKDAAQRTCNGMFSGHRDLYFDDICRAIADERRRCAKIAAPIGPYSSEWSDYEKQAYDLRSVIHRAIVNGNVASMGVSAEEFGAAIRENIELAAEGKTTWQVALDAYAPTARKRK